MFKSKKPVRETKVFYDYEKDAQLGDFDKIKKKPKHKTKSKESKKAFLKEEKKERKASDKKYIRFVLILAICILSVFILTNYESLTPQNILTFIRDEIAGFGRGDGFPVNISETNVINAKTVNNDIVLLTDTSILNYSKSGRQQYDRQHGFSSPKISTSDNLALIYDRGGKKYRIESRGRTLKNKTLDKKIIAAAISNGAYGIITESESYNAELTVYNNNFTQKDFKWYSAEHKVLDLSISPKGNMAAVIAVGAKQGQIISYLIILDFNTDKPLATVEYQNTLLLSADFKTNGYITLLGDNLCSVIPIKNPNNKIDYHFSDYSLVSFDNSDPSGCVFSIAKYGNYSSGKLVFITQEGKLNFEIPFEDQVVSLAADKRNIFVLTSSNVHTINHKGTDIKQTETSADSFKVIAGNHRPVVISNAEINMF